MTGAVDLLAVTYSPSELSVSTDTPEPTKRGKPRTSTGRWAVYCRGRRLHGGLHSSAEAVYVRELYLEGAPAGDARWAAHGAKQPSPRTDDRRRARGQLHTHTHTVRDGRVVCVYCGEEVEL